MKTRKIASEWLAAAFLTVIVLPLAHAGALRTDQRVDEIVVQQQLIRAEVKAVKNGWDEIPEQKRSELLGKQDGLLATLAGKDTVGELSESDQVEVANTLEWIKAVASNAEDERLICRRERPLGTNRVTTTCNSVAEIRHRREMTKDAMRDGERMMQIPALAPPGAQ
jgi:nucleoside phosphorylase